MRRLAFLNSFMFFTKPDRELCCAFNFKILKTFEIFVDDIFSGSYITDWYLLSKLQSFLEIKLDIYNVINRYLNYLIYSFSLAYKLKSIAKLL